MCVMPAIPVICSKCGAGIDLSRAQGVRTNQGNFCESCFTAALIERDRKSPHGKASDMLRTVRDGVKEW